jgi:hypothetical protein
MQFGIYVSAPVFDMASNPESGVSDDGSSVIIEGEEDAEVIVENETEVTAEVEEETGNTGEDQEEAEVSNEDPDDKEDGNNEKNVSDVTSPEINDHVEWNALIEEEQEVLFIFPVYLQLHVS